MAWNLQADTLVSVPRRFLLTVLTSNPTFAVGVRAMDDQHGILMDAIDELRQASVRGAGRQQIGELLNQLIDFTRMHFASEEKLLEQYSYPALEEQRAEHRHFVAHLVESAHWVQHGEIVPMRPLLSFLREWCLSHFEGMDQQYGPWLNDHGVS
jgi:hemerythrin